jgi:nucleotide-binding universal stress UspA family protein
MKTKTVETKRRNTLRFTSAASARPRSSDVEGSAVVDLVPRRLRLKRILVPTDFSAQSKKALKYALEFAEQFGASLILAHVVTPMIYPPDAGLVPIEMQGMGLNLEKQARESLAALAKREVPPGTTVRTVIRTGNPYYEIANIALEQGADLIVISTHGYTGLKKVLLGGTAERVVRHAPCPVLVVRDREKDFV